MIADSGIFFMRVLSGDILFPTEQVLHLRSSFGAGALKGVGIDGRCGGGGRVTQRTSHSGDGTLLLNHQGGRRVAQIMQVNVREILVFLILALCMLSIREISDCFDTRLPPFCGMSSYKLLRRKVETHPES